MQRGTAIDGGSEVLENAAAVVHDLGVMASPEAIEFLYPMSPDASEALERLADDVPVLFLCMIASGAKTSRVSGMVRNVLLGANSSRRVAPFLKTVSVLDIDQGALRSIDAIADVLAPLLRVLSGVEDGHPVFRRKGALICNGSAVSVVGLSELAGWVREKLSDNAEQ